MADAAPQAPPAPPPPPQEQRSFEDRFPPSKVEFPIKATKDFIVFLDPEDDVDWETSAEFDARRSASKMYGQMGVVENRVAALQSLPVNHMPKDMRRAFRRMVGEGLARAFEGSIRNALSMLKDAESFYYARSHEIARKWILSAGAVVAALFLLLAICLWVKRDYWEPLLGHSLFRLLVCAAAGAVGAAISMSRRMGTSNLNPAGGRLLHYLEAGTRVVVGAAGAAATVLAISAGAIPQGLQALFSPANGLPATLILCMAAGLSERVLPPFVEQLVQKAHANEKETPDATPPPEQESQPPGQGVDDRPLPGRPGDNQATTANGK